MESPDEITNMPPELYLEAKPLENYVYEALGQVSVCWNPRPTGEFDSLEATKVGQELIRHINTDVPHACGIVFKSLREDPEYYQAWQANIAMAFKDNMDCAADFEEDENGTNGVYTVTPEQLYRIANDAAKHFLNLLIKPIE